MERERNPAQVLAHRLRSLRKEHWPGVTITQAQLAAALGGDQPLSVPLVSSWESAGRPKIPPIHRLEAYAAFFATHRSLEGGAPRLIDPAEMTDEERLVKDDLKRELMRLRSNALGATSALPVPEADGESPDPGLWTFGDGKTITLVCAQLPPEMLAKMPYSDPADPDYIALYSYADLDSLFELHGHVRASNPTSQVNLRTAQYLRSDDYTSHLVLVGGVDWNVATRSAVDRLDLPVEQVTDWDTPEGAYFEVRDGDQTRRILPRLEQTDDGQILHEDVALFARAVNPYNHKRTVTICNGMYGRGTYGAVRATTDGNFRDRNTEYLRDRFGDKQTFLILTRVLVENGAPLTPDLTLEENRLFEWASPQQ
ncbi:helix-turn-helix transcriptional regulator [Actinomadura sp. 7K534]|uniref:helix-turn-helix domain-containing protein n=1 Tax=Actinomadura sp. 7K534 TaxID=2530366 RepID=UPI001048C8E2|nr:helix-turn-helix transcriptional regulator [Actinomadura sp. 7K534]TDB85325.1 XRE family transcriptional regulator [Actinomadura sp. 7K534]